LDSAAFAGVAGVETMWYDQELTIVVNEKCVMLLWDIPLPLYAYALCAASRRMDGDGAHIGDNSPEQSPEQSPEGENKKQNVRKARQGMYRGTVTKGFFTLSHFHTTKNES
jgi:hypothetical protein